MKKVYLIKGVEWMRGLTNHEIVIMARFAELQDFNGGISTHKRVREGLCEITGLAERTVYRIFGYLVDKGLLKRIDSGYYLINPATFYKFRVSEYISRVESFEKGVGYEQEF